MLTEKKQEKLEKILGKDTVQELEKLQNNELESGIAQAEGAIKQTKDELEANEKYRELKEGLKAISQGMKEVRARQRAIVEYSLHLLEESSK